MASTNFLVFDEGKQNMMSDEDYSANTQRARGVTPGIAYPNLHNKLYYQVSVMAKAIADFMVAQGANASDEDVEQLTDDISTAFTNFVNNKTEEKYLPLSGGTMKGNINASGYNITATKFIGNLQGKADSATNADLAAKANQDSQGQVINTTYVKGVTSSNDTLAITKGDNSNNNVVINNVQQAKFSSNINNGYNNGSTPLPTNTFRSDVLKLSGVGYSVQPMHCTSVVGNISNCVGIAFSGGWNTNGFLQMAYDRPQAWVGGGASENINWYKELAFTESPAFTGAPTAPTPEANDNSTKIATTAFAKSLFTASKQENGWWHDNITGFIIQWGKSNSGRINYPISFPTYGIPIFIHTVTESVDYKMFHARDINTSGFTADIENGGTLNWVAIGY